MRLLIACAALVVVLGSSQIASAQDAQPKYDADFAAQMFAAKAVTDKAYACFVRVYDPAHLAKHPLQKVKAMTLLVTGEKSDDLPVLGYSFRLGVNFRSRKGNFDSSGSCGSAGISEGADHKVSVSCAVDCDGGGIAIEMAKGNNATLVRLDRIRIWQNNKPDDEGLDLSGGADDKIFRLDRADPKQCEALIADRKELAAVRTLKK